MHYSVMVLAIGDRGLVSKLLTQAQKVADRILIVRDIEFVNEKVWPAPLDLSQPVMAVSSLLLLRLEDGQTTAIVVDPTTDIGQSIQQCHHHEELYPNAALLTVVDGRIVIPEHP